MNNSNLNNFKKKLKISISYTTNFKPSNFFVLKNYNFFKTKNNNKIISRNFFLLLLLLKYSHNKNHNKKENFYSLKTTVFVKPFYKNVLTLLRAPYRYKLARHQFMVSRYFVLLTINSTFNDLFFSNSQDLVVFLKFLKKFYV